MVGLLVVSLVVVVALLVALVWQRSAWRRVVVERDRAAEEAQEATRAHEEASAANSKLQAEVVELDAQLDRSRADLEKARRRIEELSPVPARCEGIWAAEVALAERVWRNSVAVGPDARPGVADAPDPVTAAVDIHGKAVREEIGVETVQVHTAGFEEVTDPLLRSTAVAAARELLVALAYQTDEVELSLRIDQERIVAVIDSPPDPDVPAGLRPFMDGPSTVRI